MDNIGHKSGHLMLITPERVFYAGLLGRPRERCSGAFNIYVSIEGGLWLTTADGHESYGEMAAVLPNIRHTIAKFDVCPPPGHIGGNRDRTALPGPGHNLGFLAMILCVKHIVRNLLPFQHPA